MRSLLSLLVITAATFAGPKPGDVGTPEHKKAAELVRQLGHARFAVREARPGSSWRWGRRPSRP